MSRLSRTAITLAASAFAAAAALPAAASTYLETADYSSSPSSPTQVGTGYDTLSGSLTSGDRDMLAIALGSSATRVTLDFAIADTSVGNNASFSVLYSYSPFVSEWTSNTAEKNQWGNPVGYNVETKLGGGTVAGVWNNAPNSLSFGIDLNPALGSTLYLSLISNGASNGGVVNYTVGGFADPAVVSPPVSGGEISPVPLPAGIVLLGSALGLGGLVSLRRRKTA